jgi:putative FmdB family regulatory protein
MPIYEFYCTDCNTIFNFFSRRVNTDKIPICPRCKKIKLKRIVSRFNTLKGREEGDDELGIDIDESKLGEAMAYLEREAANIDENNPRDAARLMRKLTEMTGLNLGDKWQEALSRMEAGEDPEAIEEEIGDILDSEEDILSSIKTKLRKKKSSPQVDDTLYEL